MYSTNNIHLLLKSKSVIHDINKNHIENIDFKLNNLSKNIDKIKKKVLHMNLDEELSLIKLNIDNINSCIDKVNNEVSKNINVNDTINKQLKEMKNNVDLFNDSYKIANIGNVTHSDLELINNNVCNLKLLIDSIIEKNNSNKTEIGNCFLHELINIIEPGNYNKPTDIDYNLKILDSALTQQISVYKIGYYSSDVSNQPIKLYGTMLVPNDITKEEIISYKNDIIYQLQSNYSIWQAVGPDGIWNVATIQDKSLLANENLLKINCLLTLSSLGYIVIIPDGFNTSNTSRIFTYEGETIPSVDMIRSIRKLCLSTPLIFNNFKLIDQTLKVIQLGYSSGGVYGPAIINEFYSDSPNIDQTEKITFTAGHFGGVPSIETIINNLCINGANKNKGYYRLPHGMLILIALFLGNSPIIEQIAQPGAYGNFFQLFKGKWFQNWDKFSKQIFINLFYNHELNVLAGIHNNKEDTVDPYIKPNEEMFDIRQIINIHKFAEYKEYFVSQSGWSNILRPLCNLKNIPISNIYSETDEFALLKLYELNKNYITIDCSEFFDKYMSKGDIFIEGPNKKIIISSNKTDSNIIKTDNKLIKQYDINNFDDIVDVAGDIKYMNNNEYKRYILTTSNLNKELNGHNKFIFIWFNILYYVLH